jgi:hypothetical protein
MVFSPRLSSHSRRGVSKEFVVVGRSHGGLEQLAARPFEMFW